MGKVINLNLLKAPANWLYVLCVIWVAAIIAHQVMRGAHTVTVGGNTSVPVNAPASDAGQGTSQTQK
jgi:hypothetical protein